MIETTTHVPIVVSDQDEANQSCTKLLGFEKRADGRPAGRPRWLTVAPEGQDVELTLVKGTYTQDPRPPSGADSDGNHHVFTTDGCRRDVAALAARGLKFKGGSPVEAPSGIAAYFTDPLGNHFALLQPRQRSES